MDLLEGMRETREAGGDNADLEAALQSQASVTQQSLVGVTGGLTGVQR